MTIKTSVFMRRIPNRPLKLNLESNHLILDPTVVAVPGLQYLIWKYFNL